MKPCHIKQLSSNEPQKVAEALFGLYEIDTEVFKKQDQYGLQLLKLALLQPEAFWVATIDTKYVGYLSIFTLKSARLYKELVRKAEAGKLDLPDLVEKYSKELVSYQDSTCKSMHAYIDAIAVRTKSGFVSPVQAREIRKELADAAKKDMPLGIASICTVATRKGVYSELIKLVKRKIPFEHIGGRRQAIVEDNLYRELFACSYDCQAIIQRLLDVLGSVRFGPVVDYNPILGTVRGGILIEPKE